VRKADNRPPSCAFVTKSGNLNFLEPSESLRACNGTALPLFFYNNHINWGTSVLRRRMYVCALTCIPYVCVLTRTRVCVLCLCASM